VAVADTTGLLMYSLAVIIRLHRVHEMRTIVTDDPGVCLSAFAKLLWPLVITSEQSNLAKAALNQWGNRDTRLIQCSFGVQKSTLNRPGAPGVSLQ